MRGNMGIITHGHIGITPLRITTALPLTTILQRIKKRRPSASTLTPGWGSFGDDVSLLNLAGAPNPSAGTPVEAQGDDVLPHRVEARAYWWEVEREVLRFVGANEERSTMRLVAADLIFTRVSDEELLVLVSTRTPAQIIRHVKPLLDNLFDGDSNDGQVSINTSSMDIIDDDFFFWLIYRSQHDRQVNPEIEVVDVVDAASVDARTRQTKLSRGVDMDRGEFLALVMQTTTEFGPVKVALFDSGIELDLYCEIDYNGRFSVFKQRTEFTDPPEGTSPEYLNVLYVLYYAYRVYPRLVAAWQTDSSWHAQGRDDFRTECRDLMKAALGL
jgi:hypothetical protein